MKSKADLLSLSRDISGANRGGYLSALARDLPYYGSLKKTYPFHFVCFSNMHKRASSLGLEIDTPRDVDGFVKFLRHIGDVPNGMKHPTVGRKDHSKGYISGNYRWEEQSDNSKEVMRRTLIAGSHSSISKSKQSIRKWKRLRSLLHTRGRLSASECFEQIGIGPLKCYDKASSFIKEGKLKAKIVGTRRSEEWTLVSLK